MNVEPPVAVVREDRRRDANRVVIAQRTRSQGLLLAAGAGALTYIAAVNPAEGGHYPVCPFRTLTGLSCPLCGGLRATHELLTGHPGRAFKLNALYVALLPLAVYAAVASGLAARGRTVLPQVRLSPRVTWALVVIAVVFGVVRNLPGFHAWSAL